MLYPAELRARALESTTYGNRPNTASRFCQPYRQRNRRSSSIPLHRIRSRRPVPPTAGTRTTNGLRSSRQQSPGRKPTICRGRMPGGRERRTVRSSRPQSPGRKPTICRGRMLTQLHEPQAYYGSLWCGEPRKPVFVGRLPGHEWFMRRGARLARCRSARSGSRTRIATCRRASRQSQSARGHAPGS